MIDRTPLQNNVIRKQDHYKLLCYSITAHVSYWFGAECVFSWGSSVEGRTHSLPSVGFRLVSLYLLFYLNQRVYTLTVHGHKKHEVLLSKFKMKLEILGRNSKSESTNLSLNFLRHGLIHLY